MFVDQHRLHRVSHCKLYNAYYMCIFTMHRCCYNLKFSDIKRHATHWCNLFLLCMNYDSRSNSTWVLWLLALDYIVVGRELSNCSSFLPPDGRFKDYKYSKDKYLKHYKVKYSPLQPPDAMSNRVHSPPGVRRAHIYKLDNFPPTHP